MTPDDIKTARLKAGLKRHEFAEKTDCLRGRPDFGRGASADGLMPGSIPGGALRPTVGPTTAHCRANKRRTKWPPKSE